MASRRARCQGRAPLSEPDQALLATYPLLSRIEVNARLPEVPYPSAMPSFGSIACIGNFAPCSVKPLAEHGWRAGLPLRTSCVRGQGYF
jgi:hypothetical protein